METLTVKELEEKMDEIFEKYDQGDDTHYRVVMDDGRAVMMTPYDGPYETVVKELENGEQFVELPNRLLKKNGWDLNTDLTIDVEGDNIVIKEKVDDDDQD